MLAVLRMFFILVQNIATKYCTIERLQLSTGHTSFFFRKPESLLFQVQVSEGLPRFTHIT